MEEPNRKDTRRSFMAKTVAGGLAALPALTVLNGGRAVAWGPFEDCLAECGVDYFGEVGEDGKPLHDRSTLQRLAAEARYYACISACGALKLANAAVGLVVDTAAWLANHPEAVVGTIVVIAGAAFVVVAGPGGALFLIPAL